MQQPRSTRERRGLAFTIGVMIVKPVLLALTRRDWSGEEHVPRRGGAVLVANHASHLDPLTFAYFVHEQGRVPRYLAKAALFDVFFAGWVLRSSGQIPVHRLSSDASRAFDDAVAAVREGKLVVVYPEGTLTRDPDLWPMVGKTGAARIALSAGVPVVPAAQWGAHEILYPYSTRPRLLPRHTIHVTAGPPVDLDAFRDQPITPELLHAATARIMDSVTELLEGIRHETAPRTRFDPRQAGVLEIGNPHHPRPARQASTPVVEKEKQMTKVAVFGAGSWGTAFSLVLADAGHEVTIWGRRPEVCDAINTKRENTDYLPGITLPDAVRATADPAEAAKGAELVVLAVPSQTLRANLVDWADVLPPDAILMSLMKGVELGTLKRMSEVIAEVTGAGPERIAVLTGPNLAREIAAREPAASVVACASEPVADQLREWLHGPRFRPYSSVDVVGCELGGAYKNVIALAVGMAVGLGFGDNTTASLITRGLAETARLAVKLGADPLTLMGLAGMGDLVATCSSPLSRNRTFGEKLGKGMTTEEITASTRQVAEGVKSAASILALAERNEIYAPLVEGVHAVVVGKWTTHEMMESFASRETKRERD